MISFLNFNNQSIKKNKKNFLISISLAVTFLFITHITLFNLQAETSENYVLAKAKKNTPPKKRENFDLQNISHHHLSLGKKTHKVKYPFSVSPQLKNAVDFWIMVYTKYGREYEIFHDTENLNVIYSVLNFSKLYNNPALDKKARLAILRPKLAEEEKRIQEMLLKIHEFQNQPQLLNAEEKRILKLFSNDPNPNKFLEAADAKRIRAQTGIRNNFEKAVRRSGAYIDEFERIFMESGVPVELSRLAFVESMFNPHAYSKVGASGMWQFMPATGKIYGLHIDQYTDERNDPFLAAHAAARLLKSNYEALGTWYLAMNAYNSGRATMKNAVKSTGTTDIGKIINHYRGGIYGFASRNFVPSFLAVLHITHHYPKYFKNVKPDPKIQAETYTMQSPNFLGNIAAAAGIPIEKILELNPHYSDKVRNNSLKIPAGYRVWIPKGSRQKFYQAEQKLKKSTQAKN